MIISVSLPWSSSLCTSEGQTAAGREKADKTTPCQALAETIQVTNTDVACDSSTFPVLFTHPSSEGFGVLHSRCFDRSFTTQTKDKLLLHMATKESQIQPRADLGDSAVNNNLRYFHNLLSRVALLSAAFALGDTHRAVSAGR